MEQYIFKKKTDGVNIINLKKTWEKLVLAARSIAGRFTPGAFTNQAQAAFREPRLLLISDPRADQQPVCEASYANIPIMALCNVDSPTKFIDIAVPCNNKASNSLGLMWWFLAREVLRLRGSISRDMPWEVMPDLFFYRDPEEAEKEEAAREEAVAASKQVDFAAPPSKEDWGGEALAGAPAPTDWAADGTAPDAAPPAAAAPAAPAAAAPAYQVTEDWAAQTETSDWAAQSAPAGDASTWGGAAQW